MEEIAEALCAFRNALRLRGFNERDAFSLTSTYLTEMLRGVKAPSDSA